VKKPGRPNIIFVLSDDHRYDFMGFMPDAPAFLETPNLDRMAREGAHLVNAFVSTSLCSPSRATILTGQYMHRHRVVDNQRPEPEGTVFFPQVLQKSGYQTAFVGKWHMGHDHDPVPSFDDLYRQYCETVFGLDENVGRVLAYLDESGLSDSTLVLYMGDNGFALGEHGFYDKRDAFEESIRVPMLAYAPGMIQPGTRVTQMVQNIDVASTLLDVAGLKPTRDMNVDGYSFLPLLQGNALSWRDHILYEYHWEWNFPATPTVYAIRGERYKYIYYHGVWDHDGFYDLQTDPHEQHNLIRLPAYQDGIHALKKQLFDEFEHRGGLHIPVRRPQGERLDQRKNR